ncbi:unnamed protein product [Schistocephalus solidus]|uniref:Rab GTPase-activating protein 1-like n=1 Tax=Schistocephalus solidus TaxID=70667 RepID=A0A183T8M8_SCHSO|nr:unnamed protein product [Schistocephalus solidus]
MYFSRSESLAASLSTLESPCAPSESGVKEAVTRLTADLRHLRKVGAELNNRASELQRQFEAQFNSGLTLSEELKEVLRQLDTERQEKKRMQAELDGYRLLRSASSAQVTDCLLSVSDRLRLQGGRPNCTAEELAERIRFCPSCEEMRVSAYDIARNAPSWSKSDEIIIQNLCVCCLQSLSLGLRSRLERAMADVEELRIELATQLSQGDRTERQRIASRESELLAELEGAKKEIEMLHRRMEQIEDEKDSEAEHLEKLTNKLEKLRQQQARKIAGLQTKTEQQKLAGQHQEKLLTAAKGAIAGVRQKQIRAFVFLTFLCKLLDFRNTLARMLSIDTWTIPNPESIIVQKVQALLCSTQMAAQRQFSQQWMVNPVNRISALIPQSPMRLPALDYSELQSAPFENTFTGRLSGKYMRHSREFQNMTPVGKG